jgi:hypothetical protein
VASDAEGEHKSWLVNAANPTIGSVALRFGRIAECGGAHAPPFFQTGMPSFLALSARFAEMPEPGNTMTPIGRTSRIRSLRLNGAAPGVPVPVRLEDNLRHLAVVGPAGSDALGALGTAAMQQHHVGMLGANLVERVPDRGVIVEVESAGEGDLRSSGKQYLGFGAAFGGEKVATVNHRSC